MIILQLYLLCADRRQIDDGKHHTEPLREGGGGAGCVVWGLTWAFHRYSWKTEANLERTCIDHGKRRMAPGRGNPLDGSAYKLGVHSENSVPPGRARCLFHVL